MKKAFIILLALFCMISGGTISGELICQEGGFGLYIVLALGPEQLLNLINLDSLDIMDMFMSVPRDEMFMPGNFEIEGDFIDFLPYVLLGIKLESMDMLQSGDPMGLSSDFIWVSGGNAEDENIELMSESPIGGYITYEGHFPGCKVNVANILTGEIEGTYQVWQKNYSIIVPSGFKTLEFYKDWNGNNIWDEDEVGTDYSILPPGGWGPIVFSGGGGHFITGVDVTLSSDGITENKYIPQPELSFSTSGHLRYSIDGIGELSIIDISGKTVLIQEISGNGEIVLHKNLPAGVYFSNIRFQKINLNKKFVIVR